MARLPTSRPEQVYAGAWTCHRRLSLAARNKSPIPLHELYEPAHPNPLKVELPARCEREVGTLHEALHQFGGENLIGAGLRRYPRGYADTDPEPLAASLVELACM